MRIFGMEFGGSKPPVSYAPSPLSMETSFSVNVDLGAPDVDGKTVAVSDLGSFTYGNFTGNKFYGGFGETNIFAENDYWLLRKRSAQLFTENLYARGMIRRLVTNEINIGLSPEATPVEHVLGLPEDSLAEWTEDAEDRFALWGSSPRVCDWKRERTFGALQRIARAEALVSGDVLVVMRLDRRTGMPSIQLISGDSVTTPWSKLSIAKGHKVVHGVEFDAQGRVFGYWVKQADGGHKRMPAWGEKSGRRLAWLVFGTDKRLDGVRGQPLLSIVLQSLREIDRYRDSTQRKALINSMVAAAVTKSAEKMGSLPLQGGATRRTAVEAGDTSNPARKLNMAEMMPGYVIDEMQVGEELKFYGGQGTDAEFGTFESTIIGAVAWANEIPPEILTLAFSNNYSASQAAINEFKIYLNKFWMEWGETFCAPIYQDWLMAAVLQRKVEAASLIDAWLDPARYEEHAAWVAADWYGSVKPSTDMLKSTKGAKNLIDEGWSNNAREARAMTGTKYTRNIKRLKRENQQKAEAMQPLLELQEKLKATRVAPESEDAATAAAELVLEAVDNAISEVS